MEKHFDVITVDLTALPKLHNQSPAVNIDVMDVKKLIPEISEMYEIPPNEKPGMMRCNKCFGTGRKGMKICGKCKGRGQMDRIKINKLDNDKNAKWRRYQLK